jgi:hypothetical protein
MTGANAALVLTEEVKTGFSLVVNTIFLVVATEAVIFK